MSLDPQDCASIAAFVRQEGRAIVATATPDGEPEAALVGVTALDDGTLIFNVLPWARKLANLKANGRVAVVAGTAGPVSVQFEGRAVATDGESAERYADEFERLVPGSKSRYEGYEVVVVRPDWLRVYDVSHKPPLVVEARW
ncbi:MAG: pyridoxamine 5'-phosphate oxidase family protein [Demequina sp.]|nr:pyridoxamine 5'-phosphate oxidase family protein [Demequina sp.]